MTMGEKRVLFIDNYDSFTYNVVHLLASQGAAVDVVLNDDETLVPSILDGYATLVVGPGPGNPSQQPRMMSVLRAAIEREMPIFGVCLGLQAIGEAFGASVTHAPSQMHGKTSAITHDAKGVFVGLPTPFVATRYHSLCLDEATLPSDLRITARSEDGVIQGLAHKRLPIHAVQFHPESVLSEHGDHLVRNALFGEPKRSHPRGETLAVPASATDRARIDGFAHLLKASRADGTARVVKCQNARVPFQLNVLNDAARLGFDVRHDVFVLNLDVRVARKYAAPMRGELVVGSVVTPQLFEVVRLGQPRAE